MRLLITAVILVLAAAGTAFAHARLDHAIPAVGSTVAPSPKEIVLTFTSELEPAFSSVEVVNEKGVAMQSSKAAVDSANRAQLRVPLKTLVPGTYRVNWSVLSVDTHRTTGNFTFRVRP
jgi:hypothetical protein